MKGSTSMTRRMGMGSSLDQMIGSTKGIERKADNTERGVTLQPMEKREKVSELMEKGHGGLMEESMTDIE